MPEKAKRESISSGKIIAPQSQLRGLDQCRSVGAFWSKRGYKLDLSSTVLHKPESPKPFDTSFDTCICAESSKVHTPGTSSQAINSPYKHTRTPDHT